MLTAIKIGNFKAFAKSQRIPLRPLTLIYGANSSGKSSIIHSLLFARHAQETGELDIHRTHVGGDSVDLGGFRQFIHRRNVGNRMEWAAEIDTASFTGRLAELLAPVKRLSVSILIGIALDDEGQPLQEAIPEIHSYEIQGDGKTFVRMSKRRDRKLQLDFLDHEHPLFREVIKAIIETSTTAETLQISDYEGIDQAVKDIVPEVVAFVGNFLPEGLAKSEAFSLGSQIPLFPISRERRTEDMSAAVRFFIPRKLDELIRGIAQFTAKALTHFQYLGPLRSYPPRHLVFSQHHDPNWFAGGGYAWDVVRRDARVREQVNNWLSASDRLQTPYELQIRRLVALENIQEHLADYLDSEWWSRETEELALYIMDKDPQNEAKHFIDSLKTDELPELVMIDRRSNTIVSHRDVGIGVSQVLPVLVGAYASKNQLIAIEQPEIHLHPALQADIGDVFIESALGEGKNRFLIETHSEHLLLRIMRRMRETYNGDLPDGLPKVKPEDVCILFVRPKGTSSVVFPLELDEEGQLLDAWPGGFFEEGYRERFS